MVNLGNDILSKIFDELLSKNHLIAQSQMLSFPGRGDLLGAMIDKNIFNLIYPFLFRRITLVQRPCCARASYALLAHLIEKPNLAAQVISLTYRSPPLQPNVLVSKAPAFERCLELLVTQPKGTQLREIPLSPLPLKTLSLTTLNVHIYITTEMIIAQIIQSSAKELQDVTLVGQPKFVPGGAYPIDINLGDSAMPSLESLTLLSVSLKISQCDSGLRFPRLQDFSVRCNWIPAFVLDNAPNLVRLTAAPDGVYCPTSVLWTVAERIPRLHRLTTLELGGLAWSLLSFEKVAPVLRALPNTLEVMDLCGFPFKTAVVIQERLADPLWLPRLAIVRLLRTPPTDDDFDDYDEGSLDAARFQGHGEWRMEWEEDGQRTLVRVR